MQVDSTNGAIPILVQKKAQDTVKNLMEKMINDAFKNSAELEAMTAQATGKGQNINVKA
jgi:hypothetical protein